MTAALALIDALSTDDLDDIPSLTGHYAQALAALVDAKLHDRELTQVSEPPQRTQLVDLMAALQQSVRDARADRGKDLDDKPPSRRTNTTSARRPRRR